MAETYRRHSVIEAPIDDVWAIISDPQTHPEAHFRCTASGTFTRFALTPAQDDTFVEIEAGVLPTNFQARVFKALGPLFFRRWLQELLDALPKVVTRDSGKTTA